jgi:hypothetical protein
VGGATDQARSDQPAENRAEGSPGVSLFFFLDLLPCTDDTKYRLQYVILLLTSLIGKLSAA